MNLLALFLLCCYIPLAMFASVGVIMLIEKKLNLFFAFLALGPLVFFVITTGVGLVILVRG